MDAVPNPLSLPPAASLRAAVALPAPAEDDVPLGWECANPALQIERWQLETASLSSKS